MNYLENCLDNIKIFSNAGNCESRKLLVAVSCLFLFDLPFVNSNNFSVLTWMQLPVNMDKITWCFLYLDELSKLFKFIKQCILIKYSH